MTSSHAIDFSAEVDHQAEPGASALRASGRVAVTGAVPRPGELLRDFTLPSTKDAGVRLAELRGERSLVLVFAGAPPLPQALITLLQCSSEFEVEDATVVAVLAAPPAEARQVQSAQAWRFSVLADETMAIHRKAGADRAACAVYVTDHFGEIFAEWRTAAGDTLPPAAEVTRTLRQIELLCPECGFPEWLVD